LSYDFQYKKCKPAPHFEISVYYGEDSTDESIWKDLSAQVDDWALNANYDEIAGLLRNHSIGMVSYTNQFY
jgi:hypothetical protein